MFSAGPRRSAYREEERPRFGPVQQLKRALTSPRLGRKELLRRLEDSSHAVIIGEGAQAVVKGVRHSGLPDVFFRQLKPVSNPDEELGPVKPPLRQKSWGPLSRVILPFAELGPYQVLPRVRGITPFHSPDIGQSLYTLTVIGRSLRADMPRVLPELYRAADEGNIERVQKIVRDPTLDPSKVIAAVKAQRRFESDYRGYLTQLVRVPDNAYERLGDELGRVAGLGIFPDTVNCNNFKLTRNTIRVFDLNRLPHETARQRGTYLKEGLEAALLGHGSSCLPEHRYDRLLWTPEARKQMQDTRETLKPKLEAFDRAYWKGAGLPQPDVSDWN